MSEKKASEILLELTTEIKSIQKQLKLQEFQLRLIINNFNRLFKITGENQTQDYLQNRYKNTEEKIETIVLANSIEERKKKLEKLKEQLAPNADFSIKQESSNTEKIRLIPVTQVLMTNDGNPIVSASVSVMNKDGAILRKTNTNTVGRWQIFLPIGSYTVKVNGDIGNVIVDYSQTFEVKETTAPITLPVPESFIKPK